MQNYNLHTHTYRCGHARGSDRAYVENAIKAGIKYLGFSDHVPYPFENHYVSGMRMQVSEIESYVDSLTKLKTEYEKDIRIYIGFEAEYFPTIFQKLLDCLKDYPVDYLIMGQHFVDMEGPGSWLGNPSKDSVLLERYVDQVIEGLSTGYFTYLAHPELPNFIGSSDIFHTQMKRICDFSKANDIPLEINGLGVAEERWYPRRDFINMAKEEGCPLVMGLDAHDPQVFANKNYLRYVDNYIEDTEADCVPWSFFENKLSLQRKLK